MSPFKLHSRASRDIQLFDASLTLPCNAVDARYYDSNATGGGYRYVVALQILDNEQSLLLQRHAAPCEATRGSIKGSLPGVDKFQTREDATSVHIGAALSAMSTFTLRNQADVLRLPSRATVTCRRGVLYG